MRDGGLPLVSIGFASLSATRPCAKLTPKGMTLDAIGRAFGGVSRERVRQIVGNGTAIRVHPIKGEITRQQIDWAV